MFNIPHIINIKNISKDPVIMNLRGEINRYYKKYYKYNLQSISPEFKYFLKQNLN